jgi:hypothetical protein
MIFVFINSYTTTIPKSDKIILYRKYLYYKEINNILFKEASIGIFFYRL